MHVSIIMLKGVFFAALYSVSAVPQWALNHIDTFNGAGEENYWSVSSLSHCGNSHDTFLGGSCVLGGDVEANKKFSGLLSHTHLRITARAHFIDKWEGETLYLEVDGKIVWAKNHYWCPQRFQKTCERYGLDSCGQSYPDALSVPVTVDIPHTSSSVKVSFKSTLGKKDRCTASFGIDDVALWTLDSKNVKYNNSQISGEEAYEENYETLQGMEDISSSTLAPMATSFIATGSMRGFAGRKDRI